MQIKDIEWKTRAGQKAIITKAKRIDDANQYTGKVIGVRELVCWDQFGKEKSGNAEHDLVATWY